MELSVGQKVNITLNYLDQGDKALDLYYLMDLSATMEKSKVRYLHVSCISTYKVHLGF